MTEHADQRPHRHTRTRPGRAEDEQGGRTARFDRRRFIGWGAAGGVVTAAAVLGIAESSGPGSESSGGPPIHPHRASSPSDTVSLPGTIRDAATPIDTVVEGVTLPLSPTIVAENAKTGHAWWPTTPQGDRSIEGYADRVSALVGDTVTLFVNTAAAGFHVEAYRMGYYQGIGGRLVWQSAEIPGVQQPPPLLLQPTNTIECQWTPSVAFTVDPDWPPGTYLLKLVGSGGEQQFVPLCIRDDTSRAAVVIQNSVTTWQAYNRWGGYSLYFGNRNGLLSFTHDATGATYADRARVVSFDRPYDYNWASGAADFIGNEFPVVYQAERLGLDVTYWTDVDLHARPELLNSHKALVSLGHDEYWSAPMRDGAASALAAGVNLAFLGANACYRQIRFEPTAVGPNRRQVCYKSAAEDPMTAQDPALVTVNWPQAPVSRPESELIGITYQDIDALADMVVTDPESWLLAGTGLDAGQHLPKAVVGEFDRYVPGGAGPTNVDVVAHSLVANRRNNYSDVTWYTVPGGGGVFATGNASWVGAMSDSVLIPANLVPDATPGLTAPLLRIMMNLYSVIGRGPASAAQPSGGNWRTVYTTGSPSSAAPDTVNAA